MSALTVFIGIFIESTNTLKSSRTISRPLIDGFYRYFHSLYKKYQKPLENSHLLFSPLIGITSTLTISMSTLKASTTLSRMQLHTGAENYGNVIFRYSELTSQYHFDASIDINRM